MPNFATNHKLPKEVTLWDKADRLCEDQAIENIVQFMKAFNMWWLKLQPTAHVKGGSLLLAKNPFDWKKMNKAGKSGFVLILLVLTWWRAACGESGSAEWEVAVDDAAEVL